MKKLQENIFDLFNNSTSDFPFETASICHIKINQQSQTKNQPKPKPSNLYKVNIRRKIGLRCGAVSAELSDIEKLSI